MYRLLESIRLEDGRFHNLSYHQHRMDESVRVLSGRENQVKLADLLYNKPYPEKGMFKCRLMYTTIGNPVVVFIPYSPAAVQSLAIVYDEGIDYTHKFEDRSAFVKLKSTKKWADDILIVKQGRITDASYSNVIFFDGNRWITPVAPLLRGVMRQVLLDAGEIYEDEITVNKVHGFKKVKLINAMLGFSGPEFPVSQILF